MLPKRPINTTVSHYTRTLLFLVSFCLVKIQPFQLFPTTLFDSRLLTKKKKNLKHNF